MSTRSLPQIVVESLRACFPLTCRPDNLCPDQSGCQFCGWLIGKFVKQVVGDAARFSEKEVPEVLTTVRSCLSEAEQDRFYEFYCSKAYSTSSKTTGWECFLKDTEFWLMQAIRPGDALFLKHVSHLSDETRAQVLDCFISLFAKRPELERVLSETLMIEKDPSRTYEGGVNNWAFSLRAAGVELIDDGDGVFEDEDVIRIHLALPEFRQALELWGTHLGMLR